MTAQREHWGGEHETELTHMPLHLPTQMGIPSPGLTLEQDWHLFATAGIGTPPPGELIERMLQSFYFNIAPSLSTSTSDQSGIVDATA